MRKALILIGLVSILLGCVSANRAKAKEIVESYLEFLQTGGDARGVFPDEGEFEEMTKVGKHIADWEIVKSYRYRVYQTKGIRGFNVDEYYVEVIVRFEDRPSKGYRFGVIFDTSPEWLADNVIFEIRSIPTTPKMGHN